MKVRNFLNILKYVLGFFAIFIVEVILFIFIFSLFEGFIYILYDISITSSTSGFINVFIENYLQDLLRPSTYGLPFFFFFYSLIVATIIFSIVKNIKDTVSLKYYLKFSLLFFIIIYIVHNYLLSISLDSSNAVAVVFARLVDLTFKLGGLFFGAFTFSLFYRLKKPLSALTLFLVLLIINIFLGIKIHESSIKSEKENYEKKQGVVARIGRVYEPAVKYNLNSNEYVKDQLSLSNCVLSGFYQQCLLDNETTGITSRFKYFKSKKNELASEIVLRQFGAWRYPDNLKEFLFTNISLFNGKDARYQLNMTSLNETKIGSDPAFLGTLNNALPEEHNSYLERLFLIVYKKDTLLVIESQENVFMKTKLNSKDLIRFAEVLRQ